MSGFGRSRVAKNGVVDPDGGVFPIHEVPNPACPGHLYLPAIEGVGDDVILLLSAW
jgi:hypothetical protein